MIKYAFFFILMISALPAKAEEEKDWEDVFLESLCIQREEGLLCWNDFLKSYPLSAELKERAKEAERKRFPSAIGECRGMQDFDEKAACLTPLIKETLSKSETTLPATPQIVDAFFEKTRVISKDEGEKDFSERNPQGIMGGAPVEMWIAQAYALNLYAIFSSFLRQDEEKKIIASGIER